MTQKEFLDLTTEQQMDLLQKEGVYIGKRHLESYTLLLYQLEAFYVEIQYSAYRTLIENIRTSSSPTELDNYLDNLP